VAVGGGPSPGAVEISHTTTARVGVNPVNGYSLPRQCIASQSRPTSRMKSWVATYDKLRGTGESLAKFLTTCGRAVRIKLRAPAVRQRRVGGMTWFGLNSQPFMHWPGETQFNPRFAFNSG